MSSDSVNVETLVQRAGSGDEQALAELFTHYRYRLKQMVRLRLDRRLQRRVDPSDVVQEAYLDISRRIKEYASNPAIPLFLWMRMLTGQRLIDTHRQHLGAKMRDAAQEVSLYRGALPQASSVSLAEKLLGKLTSVSRVAQRAELQVILQEALNSMEPLDREVLVLRHFEMLSNGECAQVLHISPTAASNRYIRALKRLKEVVDVIPGFRDYAEEKERED